MTLRLTAQGTVQTFYEGIWTTLPPKRARFELFRMSRRQLVNLISLLAAAAALPGIAPGIWL